MSDSLDELDWDDKTVICPECNRPFSRATNKYCDRKSEHKEPDLADLIVNDIEHELTGRRGVGHEFEGCDPDVQQEMRDAWADIVRKRIST